MPKLRGILDKSFNGYLTFRGFAKLKDIEKLSEPDSAYQRDLIETHKDEIKEFLSSGHNLFFPEVILGCKIANEEEVSQVVSFYDSFDSNGSSISFDFKKMKIELQTRTEFQSGDDIRNKGYFRPTNLNFLTKHQQEAQIQKPFKRIDGNHRISACNYIEEHQKNLNIPFCIVFFRDKDEEEKYSRIMFHNINYKSIPLSMEESLKLILDDERIFSDEELKTSSSFGWEYFFTRKINKTVIDEHFGNIKDIFDGQFRTTFKKLFKMLIEDESLKKENDEISRVNGALREIDTIYSTYSLKSSKNGSLFSAFMHYKLSDEKQLEGFKRWVLKNHIYDLVEIEAKSIIAIYDKIAQSKIKNIFIAMAFSEQNCSNVWDAMSTVYNELITVDGLQLDKSKQENGRFIPNRVDKGLDVSKDIIYEIKEGISKSQLVIVDLSYQKQNVYYEMGLAEAQQKPLILLHDETIPEDKVHFDVNSQSRMQYDSNNLSEFKTKLKALLKAVIEGES